MIADDYAHALYELVEESPKKGSEYLKGLKEALARRGHEKLLPRILASFELLTLKKERLTEHKKITPEKERNRVLLELYRTLVNSN